jgi:hypothetical protein
LPLWSQMTTPLQRCRGCVLRWQMSSVFSFQPVKLRLAPKDGYVTSQVSLHLLQR